MTMNRTLKRTFSILELLQESKNGMTLKEISETMDIPKTSAFDIMQSLLAEGVVEMLDKENKRYTIGIRLFELGNSYISNKSIYNVSNTHLRAVAETLNKTAFLGVLRDDKVVYIQKYEPNVSIRTTCVVGSTADVYSTSLGKSLLAFSTLEKRKQIIDLITFVKHQHNTIDNKVDFIKELERTSLRGYAIDNSENEEGIFCIGAPIFDNHGNVVAAISVSGLHSSQMELDYESIELRKAAVSISRELGYTGR